MAITKLVCSSANHSLFTDGKIMYFGQHYKAIDYGLLSFDDMTLRPGVSFKSLGNYGYGGFIKSKQGKSFEMVGFANDVEITDSGKHRLFLFKNNTDNEACQLEVKAKALRLANLFYAVIVGGANVVDAKNISDNFRFWILDNAQERVEVNSAFTF